MTNSMKGAAFNMEPKRIALPLTAADIESLNAADMVLLSGVVYTARDAAHARLVQLLSEGTELPIPRGSCIYYTGPCPSAAGEVIGPCGPTTSKRMDSYTPVLIDYGITGFIGKGGRADYVYDALKGRGVYFVVTGGAGMLIAKSVTAASLVAFEDLGTEAIRRLEVSDLPAIVAADSSGRSIF